MKRYRGTETVAAGVYLDPRRFSFVSLEKSGDLPGTIADVYLRVPVIVLLLAAPLMGGLFVVFLPLIGFVMLGWAAGGKMLDLLGRTPTAPAGLRRT